MSTPQDQSPLFSFGLITDIQYADDDDSSVAQGDMHYRASLAKTEEAVAEFNRHDLAFVAHLGDLVDHDLDNATPVLLRLAGLRAPIRHVLGNHDFYRGPAARREVEDRAALLAGYGLSSAYYGFDVTAGDTTFRFLVLDTNDVGVIAHRRGSTEHAAGEQMLEQLRAAGRPNAHPWNGTLGAAQREWLAAELREADRVGAVAIAFAHHRAYPDGEHTVLDSAELADWLAGFPALRAWFNGHDHNGAFGRHRGLPFVTLHGCAMTDRNAFAIARVYPDRIAVAGHGRQPSYDVEIAAPAGG